MTDAARPAEQSRAPLHPAIDRALVTTLVHTFYDRVRRDTELGPIFERIISDWPTHLDTLVEFWSAVTHLGTRFRGNPMQKHLAIGAIDRHHFERWLALFRETARTVMADEPAGIFIDRAERIAYSLQRGIAFARGEDVTGRPETM